MDQNMKIIAHIHTDLPSKFGLPRQSGLVEGLMGKIVFTPEYRDVSALTGLEDFSHIWIIWQFSEAVRETWSPTVRPPRLGGNKRMGVFATRSPFRPNAIGLSSVKLERIERSTTEGPVIWVSGVDLMDGTPIFDIKPYLPFTDSHPEAKGGFAENVRDHALRVDMPAELLEQIPTHQREGLLGLLSQDPRPSYQNDPTRIYGFPYGEKEIRFTVENDLLTVVAVEEK